MSYVEVDENHWFKDDMAYTDEILVHKLFVRDISCRTKNEEVLAYFSQFGEVVKMCPIPGRKLKKNTRSVTIQFANARVAAEVLQEPIHILKKRIHVSACHSWEQPGAFKANGAEVIEASAQNADDSGACGGATTSHPAPPLNILDLNDDCLENVAKYLKLDQQVRMARTCTRFRDAVEMRVRVEYKMIHFADFSDMTLSDIGEFFLMAGPTVKMICGHMSFVYTDEVAELIASNCQNVENFNFYGHIIHPITLRRLIANKNNLTDLCLRRCLLTDKAVMVIQKLSKLEELRLTGNHKITGKYLSKLTNVRELVLKDCHNIETLNFIEIVKSMKKLRLLNIENCQRLSTEAFEEMEKHCANLVVLQMSCLDIPCGSVARLPALERLEMTGDSKMVDESLFTLLAAHKSTQLEYLKVTARDCIYLRSAVCIAQLSRLKFLDLGGNQVLNDDYLYQFRQLEQLEEIGLRSCTNFTKDGLLHLIRRCTKLRHVNVHNCLQINEDFIFDVIDLVEKRQQGLPQDSVIKPVCFYVPNTSIQISILKDARLMKAINLVKVIFYYHGMYAD